MRRALFAVSLALVVGCGKSFQEADAIYKDEVEKYEKLKAEFRAAVAVAADEAEKDRIYDYYGDLCAKQEAKVKEAEQRKEAAK